MASQRDLEIRWLGDAQDLIKAADKAKTALGDTESAAKSAAGADGSTGLGLLKKGAIALGGAFVAAKIGDFVGDAIDLGIQAEEAGNKFNTVFGPAAAELGAELEALGDKAGIADFDLENMTGTLGNVLLGLGATKEEAATFAGDIATLAADVASFNGDVSATPDVLAAMTSAMTGEREALKTYGIVISEADVQQRALQESGKLAADELTTLEKATATLELIMERAASAVGDVDRNLDTAATQSARFQAELKEAQAALGEELLPIVAEALPILTDFVGLLGGAADNLGTLITAFSTSDMDVSDIKEMKQAIELANEAVTDGLEPVTAWAAAIATLGVNGSLTETSLAALKDESGLTEQQFDAARAAAVDWLEANTDLRDEIVLLKDETGRMKGGASRLSESMQELKDKEGQVEGKTENLKDAMSDLADETGEAETKTYDLIDAQKALVDPFFAAKESARKYRAALTKVNEAVGEYGEGSPEHIEALEDAGGAYLDLKGDLATLKEDGYDENIDALRDLFAEMGQSGPAVDAMIAEFQRWLDLNLDKIARITIIPNLPDDVIIAPRPGDIIALQHGGVVQGRGGGTMAMIGEAGTDEAVIPLNSQGIGMLAAAMREAGMGGGGTTVVQLKVGPRTAEEIVVMGTREAKSRGRL